MTDLTGLIKSAEKNYKQILEDFFVSIYDEKRLPSHGIEHHRRVWNTAKTLILLLNNNNKIKDTRLVSGLLLASYLHDIGMATDHGPRHGRHSLEFCKQFLIENNLHEYDFPGLTEAVLYHDNKDYSLPAEINLHTILSVADDLDAFGFTGIYRYIEIYTMRGMGFEDLGTMIRNNARKRFFHFNELFTAEETIILRHSERYEILDNFFCKYQEQVSSDNTSGGYFKVVLILSGAASKGKEIEELALEHMDSIDPVIRCFFNGLKGEMDETPSEI
jgi:hypothetical protein